MDIEKKIEEKLNEYDLVLVYKNNLKNKLIMMLVKTVFPFLEYNPLSPIFGYRGEVYGLEKDRNLAEILVKQEFEKIYVIDENLKINRKRIMDFLRVMKKGRNFWVFIKYILTGIVGVLSNMLFFYIFFKVFDFPDIPSLIAAIELSIILTFFMNNYWVFSNRIYSRSMWWRMGVYHFTLVMGIVINVGVYWILARMGMHYMLADFVGIALASLWNFYLTNAYVFFAQYQKSN